MKNLVEREAAYSKKNCYTVVLYNIPNCRSAHAQKTMLSTYMHVWHAVRRKWLIISLCKYRNEASCQGKRLNNDRVSRVFERVGNDLFSGVGTSADENDETRVVSV